MAQITSRAELEEWLKDKSADFAQVIAARAALRVLPYAFVKDVSQKWVSDFASPLFRSIAISWAARNFPAHDMVAAAAYAAYTARTAGIPYAARGATNAAAAYAARAAADASADAADAARAAAYAADASADAARAAAYAASAAAIAAYAVVWANISHDCDWLGKYPDPALAAQQMTSVGLWLAGEVNGWRAAWADASNRLLGIDASYQVWIDWCNLRFEGENDMAFTIPGDHDRTEDKAILARLADATNEDFWDKGATYVNTTLQSWIDEARARVAPPDEPPPELDHDTIATITAPLASPDVIARNNQLDVVPNAILDAQSDAFDLAEAVAVLRALVGTLRKCLTGNSSPVFALSLARYDEELEQRGAKPFIGVLTRMEEGVEAQFNADPEAFDDGVITHFKNYFAEHYKFMTHYQHHLDREKVIAELKIDDRAASGKALTSAFDAAAVKAEELFNQGLVTDGYRDEMLSQQANLKALEYSQGTSGSRRAKLLQIVQSVGFLQQTLIASATIVATGAAFPQFIEAVEMAIAALSKFFV